MNCQNMSVDLTLSDLEGHYPSAAGFALVRVSLSSCCCGPQLPTPPNLFHTTCTLTQLCAGSSKSGLEQTLLFPSRTIVDWNHLSTETVSSPSLDIFKARLRSTNPQSICPYFVTICLLVMSYYCFFCNQASHSLEWNGYCFCQNSFFFFFFFRRHSA